MMPAVHKKIEKNAASKIRVPTLLLTKNPGLFQDFPGPHEKFSRTFLEHMNA